MINEVKKAMAAYINVSAIYLKDSQPLKKVIPEISFGWYISPFIQPLINFHFERPLAFPGTASPLWMQLENQSYFHKPVIKSFLSFGLFKHPSAGGLNGIWKIGLQKKLYKSLLLTYEVKRSPYLYTSSSINNPVLTTNYIITAKWHPKDKWDGALGYHLHSFDDNNNSTDVFAWLTGPPIKFSPFKFRFGYSFSYADTKENRFISDVSGSIQGSYAPYYTPQQSTGHYLLGNLQMKISKIFQFYLGSKVGLFAEIDNPYLYLSSINNQNVVVEGFEKINYTPFNINGLFTTNLSEKVSFTLGYLYEQTAFYDIHHINISYKKKFINGGK